MERAKPVPSVTLRCQTDRCGCQTRWLCNASVPLLIVKGIGEGRLSLMFTSEYSCEAFPVRNQVCDFWEVLVTQGLAVRKKWWCLAPERLGCLQTCKNSELNCTVVISVFPTYILETPPRQERLPASVRAEGSPASGFLTWFGGSS